MSIKDENIKVVSRTSTIQIEDVLDECIKYVDRSKMNIKSKSQLQRLINQQFAKRVMNNDVDWLDDEVVEALQNKGFTADTFAQTKEF